MPIIATGRVLAGEQELAERIRPAPRRLGRSVSPETPDTTGDETPDVPPDEEDPEEPEPDDPDAEDPDAEDPDAEDPDAEDPGEITLSVTRSFESAVPTVDD